MSSYDRPHPCAAGSPRRGLFAEWAPMTRPTRNLSRTVASSVGDTPVGNYASDTLSRVIFLGRPFSSAKPKPDADVGLATTRSFLMAGSTSSTLLWTVPRGREFQQDLAKSKTWYRLRISGSGVRISSGALVLSTSCPKFCPNSHFRVGSLFARRRATHTVWQPAARPQPQPTCDVALAGIAPADCRHR
jgi:hypothetical protein